MLEIPEPKKRPKVSLPRKGPCLPLACQLFAGFQDVLAKGFGSHFTTFHDPQIAIQTAGICVFLESLSFIFLISRVLPIHRLEITLLNCGKDCTVFTVIQVE